MGIEIERKFLVISLDFKEKSHRKTYFRQGYICADRNKAVRVRICETQSFLTIKTGGNHLSHLEFEYPIPINDANQLLETCCSSTIIEKTRYEVIHDGMLWEVDEFWGENEGLIVAEIELEHENQIFTPPQWLGAEVTGDARYYNSNLISSPYKGWAK